MNSTDASGPQTVGKAAAGDVTSPQLTLPAEKTVRVRLKMPYWVDTALLREAVTLWLRYHDVKVADWEVF